MENLLKLLILLLPWNYSDLSIRIVWLIHLVQHQSHTIFSVCSINCVNHFVSQFELFIHVLGQCSYQHWGQCFLSSEVFCCNDQLIPQLHKLIAICLSRCKFLYQLELFVVIFLENIEFYIQLIGILLGPRKSTKSVLPFAKVHIVGTS